MLRWILLAAFLLRLAAVLWLPDQHFSDAADYRDLEHLAPRLMPLYPLAVWLAGPLQGVMDAVFATVTVWLIAELAKRFGASEVCGAFIAAVYPFFIFYAAVGLTESLFCMLLTGAFLCWYRERMGWGYALAWLAVLTRPTIAPLIPILAGYFGFSYGFGYSRQVVIAGLTAIQQALLSLIIGAVLLSPWWIYNYQRYDAFVPLNLGGGYMLYAGNNPLNVTGDGRRDIDVDVARFEQLGPIARDKAETSAALGWISANPVQFARLSVLKFVRFWSLWPNAEEYRSWPLLAISAASFGPVLILGLLGLRLAWPLSAPILMLVAYLTLVHCITVGSIRYRLPLEPFLIVMTSVALSKLWSTRHALAAGHR